MLITLEGIDGSGKTTVWEALRGEFEFTFTREPTDTWYGDAVRQSVADDDADPVAEAFLYVADHAAHLAETVRPALRDDDVVVTDRYSDSRYAYQGATLAAHPYLDVDDPLEYVQRVHDPWTRPPDATVYLDVDPETGARRAGATNKMEQVAFLERVADNYERLIDDDPDRFVRIDATRPQEAVLDEVERTVAELL